MTNRYRITIQGELDELTALAFEDVQVERSGGRTLLHTDEIDQAGLNGLLDRLRAVGAVLVGVRQVVG